MKKLILLFCLITVWACGNKKPRFEPIEHAEELSEKQIDSIMSQFSFIYEKPMVLDSTNQVLIPLAPQTNGKLRKASRSNGRKYSDKYRNEFPRYWNILFYNRESGSTRLLTRSKTKISSIHPIRNQKENSSKIMDQKILYRLSQTDYNHDNLLNGDDPELLFISDIDGLNLKQISPDDEQLEYFDVMPNANQIILRTLRDTNRDSLFNEDDNSILYQANLKGDEWNITEVIDSFKRNKIDDLYFEQWLTKKE